MLITGQSWGPAGCWLYDWWAGVADTKERLVGEPRGRRALVLYINCTVIGRAAGGCRASLKLLVQLDAAEEGLGAMTAPLGNAAGTAGDLLAKVFWNGLVQGAGSSSFQDVHQVGFTSPASWSFSSDSRVELEKRLI